MENSSATFNVAKEREKSIPSTKNRPSSRRTNSFSSSSSSSFSSSFRSSNLSDESPLISPPSPLQIRGGVPFSWEKLPGIPKKQTSTKKNNPSSSRSSSSSTTTILPLMPPPATPPTSKRFSLEEIGMRNKKNNSTITESFRRDPFFAAFVECCKDDDDDQRITTTTTALGNFLKGTKVARNLSDRFGFVNLYTSCKRTCAVSESIIYIPRSSRSSDDLWINPRSA